MSAASSFQASNMQPQQQQRGNTSQDQSSRTMMSSEGTKIRCGIIGIGEEGKALLRKLTKHGHMVKIADSKGPQEHSGLADETGANVVEMKDVVKDVDVIFLSVPEKAVAELPKGLFKECPTDTIIVDCCNYYPSRDGDIQEIVKGMPESVWVKNQIGKDVIKAFNSVLAGSLEESGRPKGSEGRIAIPMSGDDSRAKEKLAKLIDEMGFDPYDAGDLASSWRQQPGSPAYCTNLDRKSLETAMRSANKEMMPKLRDEAYRKMTESDRHMDWKSLCQMLRETYAVDSTSKQMGMEKFTTGQASSSASTTSTTTA